MIKKNLFYLYFIEEKSMNKKLRKIQIKNLQDL
jgi:hypothetical protein